MSPSYEDVLAAAARIAPFVHRTPVVTCSALDELCGAQLFLKCENLQKVGAFKARGATNAVLSLSDEEAARGVATHSSGNHAQALALAARRRGIPAWIVMPTTAPAVKRAAVAGYGAEIVPCEPTLAAREQTLREVVARADARHLVVSFSDEGFLTRAELERLLAPRGRVTVLARGQRRYVGAQIGIHNPRGERVGTPGRLRNVEYVFVATRDDWLPPPSLAEAALATHS